MSRSFGKKPEALPEAQPAAMPDANAQTAPARPQFLKYGVVIGIFLFAATSILASNFALRPGPDHLLAQGPDGEAAPTPSEVLQFTSSITSQYELIENKLGPPPDREQPTPEQTAQFIKEMPDRFSDVAAKLDAHSRRPGRESNTQPERTMPRVIRREELSGMAENARAEFKDVNQVLGVSSRATDAPAGAIPWSDLGVADLDDISPAKKEKIASVAIAQTAAAFQKMLPLEDAPGITLFAVEADRTVLYSRYRVANNLDAETQAEAARALRRRACLGATMDMTLRLGGQYEYVVYDEGGLIIDRFTITENSCT